MNKRLLAFFLALIMLFGMLPASVFAEEGTDVTSCHQAVYSVSITADGQLTETAWQFYCGRVFDAVWSSDTLYLGVKTGGATLTVSLNGYEFTATGDPVELELPFSQFGLSLKNYDQTVPMTLILGETVVFDGLLGFCGVERAQAITSFLPNTGAVITNKNTYLTTLDNGIRMEDRYEGEVTNNGGGRIYQYRNNLTAYADRSKTLWAEFDLCADAMPVETVSKSTDAGNSNFGFFGYINPTSGTVFPFGFVNTTDGLVALFGSARTTFHSVAIGKQLEETFRVTIGLTPDNAGLLYIDGQFMGRFENILADLGSGYVNQGLYFGLWRRYAVPVSSADDYDITITNVVVGCGKTASVLDDLTINSILGSNTSSLNITDDLYLPDTLDNSQIAPVSLTWTSSDTTVIDHDGTLYPTTEDKSVTVTAQITGTELTKSFSLVVAKQTLEADIASTAVYQNGTLTEAVWYNSKPFALSSGENAPTGTISVLWDKNQLYFGITHSGADELSVTLGEKTFNVSLADGTFSENTMGATAVTADGSAEIWVPYDALELRPTDYNKVLTTIEAQLTNETGSTVLAAAPIDLLLMGRTVEEVSGFASLSTVSMVDGTVAYDLAAGEDGLLAKNNLAWIDRNKDITLTQTLHFTSLPVSDGAINQSYIFSDRYFFFLQAHNGPRTHQMVDVTIYNAGDGKLMLRAANGKTDDSAPAAIDLGVSLGDTFRLDTTWGANDSLRVYVNGVWKGTIENATFVMGFSSQTWLYMRCTPTSSAASFTVSNLAVINKTFETIGDEITPEAIFGDLDLTNVTADLPLLENFESAYLGTVPLTWATSDTDVIAPDGTVTQPTGTAPANVDVNLSVAGQSLWTVRVTVPSTEPADGASPSRVTAAFTAETITLNGTITEMGWSLREKIGTAGRFGVQWDSTYLYLAFEGGVPSALKLNNVTVDTTSAAVSGSYAELRVALSDLGLTVTDYGITIPASITLGSSTWNGTIKLTSIDWADTDNAAHRISATTGTQYLDGMTADYVGSVQTTYGYDLYNRYNFNGTNVEGGRVYAIFTSDNEMRNAIADRSATTYIEFDLQIDSMPVLTVGEATGWNNITACYGFAWYAADDYTETASGNVSNMISCGVFNTTDGLQFAIMTTNGTKVYALNRQLGDLFRIGTAWQPDGTVVIYLDGQVLDTVENAERTYAGVGAKLISASLYRKGAAASRTDDIEVHLTGLSVGKFYGESLLDSLTFDVIRGENTDAHHVTQPLTLPATLSNSQISGSSLIWESSDPSLISRDGLTVHRPDTDGKAVTMTATCVNTGKSVSFTLYVPGLNPSGTVQIVEADYNPAVGTGTVTDSYSFTLDTNNNSIILALKEQQIFNAVILKDGDSYARLNEEVLTLWISDDNVTYTEIKDFKLLHQGQFWYLYDFTASAKYVKVHCTHYDGREADFTGIRGEMLQISNEAVFGDNGGSFERSEIIVTNETEQDKRDDAWVLDTEAQRVLLGEELLYHYVEDGKTYVRIPEVKAGEAVTLTVLSGNDDAMDISNKEYVYEVAYGTRETYVSEDIAYFLCTLNNGTIVSMTNEGPQLYRSFSYDNGLTWTEREIVECATDWFGGHGGFIYNRVTGRIIYQGHMGSYDHDNPDISTMETRFIYSDDNGETWNRLGTLQTDAYYILSYSDGIQLSTYDGDGPNVDFVFPLGSLYVEKSFCARIAYTTDAGLTWKTSDTKIITEGMNVDKAEEGVSEANILEMSDGTLVLIARRQGAESTSFARSYSYDHGITWKSPVEITNFYTVNTQPILYRYDSSDLLIWSGNNILGGSSYRRFPINVAVSTDSFETIGNIQDLYVKTSLQGMTMATMNQATNPSVQKVGEDSLLIGWTHHGNGVIMLSRVDDFTDYFYRTKGAYDDFEHGTIKYEGWSTILGFVELAHSNGNHTMQINGCSAAVRSIPYLKDGRIAMEIYSTDGSLSVELQSTHSPTYGLGSPAGFLAENGVITFLGAESASGLTLQKGWNTIVFDVNNGVTLSVNGSEPVTMPFNTEIGDYVTYVYICNNGNNAVQVDDFLAQDYTTERIPETNGEPEEPEIEKFDVVGANMKLGNDLSMNFFVKASDITGEGWYVEIVRDDSKTVIALNDSVKSGSYYKLTYPGFAAKEMTDEIVITIYDADGNARSNPWTDSLRAYAMRILVREDAQDSDKTLMVDMLNYGAAAQEKFTYKTEDLANSLLTDEQKAYATASVELTDNRDTGVNYYGSSLNLKSNIQMNVYFTNVTEDMTARITYTNHNGEAREVTAAVVMSGDYGKVTVESMVVADVYELLTVEVKDADGNVFAYVIDSVESYCYRTMADQPLNEYLMKFAQSAWKSFHS